MKFRNIFLLFLISFLLTLGQSFSAPEEKILILANVDNHIITNIDILGRYKFFLTLSKINVDSKEEKLLILNQLLQKMIDEELQFSEAKNLNLVLEEEELNAVIESIARDQNKTVTGFKKIFSDKSISYDNYIKQIKSQILWSKIVNKIIAPKIKVSDLEIRETIELRKIKSNEVKFFLSEIFIPLYHRLKGKEEEKYAADLANKLTKELRSGKDFKSLVKQFSASPTASLDGEIGWMGKNDLDNLIYKAIEKIKPGEISEPIFMKDGYYIFKVLDKKIINTIKDEDIDEIKNDIFNIKLNAAAKGYLMDLRKSSFIEINRNNIKLLL